MVDPRTTRAWERVSREWSSEFNDRFSPERCDEILDKTQQYGDEDTSCHDVDQWQQRGQVNEAYLIQKFNRRCRFLEVINNSWTNREVVMTWFFFHVMLRVCRTSESWDCMSQSIDGDVFIPMMPLVAWFTNFGAHRSISLASHGGTIMFGLCYQPWVAAYLPHVSPRYFVQVFEGMTTESEYIFTKCSQVLGRTAT